MNTWAPSSPKTVNNRNQDQGRVVQGFRLLILAGWQGRFKATIILRRADEACGPSRDWFLPLLFECDWSVSTRQNGGPAK